jgi:aryl-alcohol dehydrogenase-like predicted oxidoreductase
VERRELGLTGIQLSVIGVGARAVFDVIGKESQRARRSLVDEALASSVNFFETSPDSGEADGILASSLTGRRSRAVVASSLHSGDMRLVHAQIDRLLRLFDERLDLLFVEGPESWSDFEPVFRQMKSDRTLHAAGVSCPDPAGFPALAGLIREHALDVIQIAYNPATPQAAREILPLAAQAGIGVIVGQPFENGDLLATNTPGGMLGSLRRFRLDTLPQAILKWILADSRVSSVVVGTRRRQHLLENLAAGEPPWLDPGGRKLMIDHYRHNPVDMRYR